MTVMITFPEYLPDRILLKGDFFGMSDKKSRGMTFDLKCLQKKNAVYRQNLQWDLRQSAEIEEQGIDLFG